MSSTFQHHRTRSQSRFPTVADKPLEGISTLERAHRSKSFDNRRDFWGANSNDASLYYPRTNVPKGRGTRESFFNDSITIPIHKTNTIGQFSNTENVDLKPANSRQYQSAIEGLNKAENDDEWTSYDKSVRYKYV